MTSRAGASGLGDSYRTRACGLEQSVLGDSYRGEIPAAGVRSPAAAAAAAAPPRSAARVGGGSVRGIPQHDSDLRAGCTALWTVGAGPVSQAIDGIAGPMKKRRRRGRAYKRNATVAAALKGVFTDVSMRAEPDCPRKGQRGLLSPAHDDAAYAGGYRELRDGIEEVLAMQRGKVRS